MKFYQWYSQALGAVLGITSSIYCYLIGNLLLYSNLDGNFDLLSFNGILASYTLYPLCFLTFIMAILLAIPSLSKKKFINIELTKINSTIIYLTVIIGILGCTIYFIIPALLLLLKDLIILFKYYQFKINNNTNIIDGIIKEAEHEEDSTENNTQLLCTKNEIAIHLLNKNASIDFITEITGLSKDYIDNLNTNTQESNKK